MRRMASWMAFVGLGALALVTSTLNVRATVTAYRIGDAQRLCEDVGALNVHRRTQLRQLTATANLEVARADLGLSTDDLFPSIDRVRANESLALGDR